MDADEKLVRLAQEGEEEAFEKLYQKYVKMVYGFIFNKIRSREETKDLTSEIWFSVLRSLNQFAFVSSFKNWLFGIVKHKILDYLQEKYKIEKVSLIENISLGQDIEETTEENETKKQRAVNKLEMVLSNLSDKYRQVLTLRFLKGYSTAEVAKELGLSVNNIKVIQYRALQKARETAV